MAHTTQIGWHIDTEVADQAISIARTQGVRPGRFCSLALQAYIEQVSRRIDSRELEMRVLAARGITNGEGLRRLLRE